MFLTIYFNSFYFCVDVVKVYHPFISDTLVAFMVPLCSFPFINMIKEDEIAGACGTEERWIYIEFWLAKT